jgi:hypothetical protein
MRTFTLEQANAVVNAIRPMWADILELRQKILQKKPEAWPTVEKAAGNGGGRAASEIAREFERLNTLVHEILQTGAVIKDLNTGLVDFLHECEGREVFLCWQYGEERVAFWHEIGAGYAERQKLE